MSELLDIGDVLEAAALTAAAKAPRSAREQRAPSAEGLRTHRLLSLIGTLSLFGVAFAAEGLQVQVPATGAVVALVFGAGLGLAAAIIAARTEKQLTRLDAALVALALLALVAWTAGALYHDPGYGTDEAAFQQAAAERLLHGHDPYGANLLPSLSRFRVPIQFATYTLNGGLASTLGYPALPVLLVAGVVALTGGTQAVPIADVAVLIVATLLMFRLLPRNAKALAAIVPVGLPILPIAAVSGLTAVICMACLVPVAFRWSEVGVDGQLSARHRWQALALGLALATQQLAWFIAPFLLVGVYLMRRPALGRAGALRVLAAYGGLAAVTFALIDAPFVVWHPAAWLHGVLAPLTQHAIPTGEGVIALALYLHVGGGAIGAYDEAAGALYLALLAIYAMRFRRLARGCFVLPSIALFFAGRSLAEYFMVLVAVIAVGAATVDAGTAAAAAELGARKARSRIAATLALPLPAALLLAIALATPAPLTMRIAQAQTTGQLHSVWRLRVIVHNRSGEAVVPHFATNSVGYFTAFWNVVDGPARLPAHATATYVLAAPNVGSMPQITSPFMLAAFASSPQSISTASTFTPQPYTATVLPDYVNRVLPAGRATTLHVQLDSPLGRPVSAAGVRVALGQVIYGQEVLIPAQARINGAQEGATPIFATTDRNGVARFTIDDAHPQGQPVYLQAWIQPRGGYPFGYSEIVSVLWR